jgi:uncharacterized protein involved in exopolysaccharide biosynthesis
MWDKSDALVPAPTQEAGLDLPFPVISPRTAEQDPNHMIRSILRLLAKRAWILGVSALAGAALAALFTAREVRQYDASARLAIAKEANTSLHVGSEEN